MMKKPSSVLSMRHAALPNVPALFDGIEQGLGQHQIMCLP